MSAAAFLKDKYYNVVVIEKSSKYGGHCDTEYFHPTNSSNSDWIDIGVQIYQDIMYDNAAHFGTWTLDSRAFVSRFAKSGVYPYASDQATTIFGIDFKQGIPLRFLPSPNNN